MANWYGAARSNYVRVKDMEGLSGYLMPFCVTIEPSVEAYPGHYCLLSQSDSGGWESYVDDDGEDRPLEFERVCEFLEPGQVLVTMVSGHEKLRYVTGDAEAYLTSTGDSVSIGLNAIYQMAREELGFEGDITPCEY